MIIDLHCDTIHDIYSKGKSLLENDCHIDINKLKKSGYLAQCFAMFVPAIKENSTEICIEMIDKLESEAQKYNLKLLKPNEPIKDELVGIITIEDGGCLKGKIENLHYFYNRGVKMIALTWNYENEIGYPNFKMCGKDTNMHVPNTETGLKEAGKEIVLEMDRLGMLVDVSHLSDKGFYDVASLVKGPFVASHSNCRSICPNVRNLTDDMIKILSEHKGIMGINFCTDFVNEDSKETKVTDLVKHINHAVSIGGIDVVALGTDFDGIPPTLEIKDASYMYMLRDELKKYYSDHDIDKIFYLNALRVLNNMQNID